MIILKDSNEKQIIQQSEKFQNYIQKSRKETKYITVHFPGLVRTLQ